MKVYLVWYSDKYNPIEDVLKVFTSGEKAEDYINSTNGYDKECLHIEEKEVE